MINYCFYLYCVPVCAQTLSSLSRKQEPGHRLSCLTLSRQAKVGTKSYTFAGTCTTSQTAESLVHPKPMTSLPSTGKMATINNNNNILLQPIYNWLLSLRIRKTPTYHISPFQQYSFTQTLGLQYSRKWVSCACKYKPRTYIKSIQTGMLTDFTHFQHFGQMSHFQHLMESGRIGYWL